MLLDSRATCTLHLGCHTKIVLMLVGPGEVNWHSLITVFSSEMLKFEEEQRQLEEAANALALEGAHTPPTRKGSGNADQLSSPRGENPSYKALQPLSRPNLFSVCQVFREVVLQHS